MREFGHEVLDHAKRLTLVPPKNGFWFSRWSMSVLSSACPVVPCDHDVFMACCVWNRIYYVKFHNRSLVSCACTSSSFCFLILLSLHLRNSISDLGIASSVTAEGRKFPQSPSQSNCLSCCHRLSTSDILYDRASSLEDSSLGTEAKTSGEITFITMVGERRIKEIRSL